MKVHWQPQKKQEKALSRLEEEILYGGARGGGKTDAGMAWLLYDKDNPLFRGLVIRRNADDLRDWIDRAREMYRPTHAEFVGQPAEIRFPSGAIIRTGHLKDENAYTKYQGHEYHRILIEELSHIPREKDYLKLISSNRTTVPELRPQVFATTNPDEPGLEWIKAHWGIPDYPDFDEIYTNTYTMTIGEKEITRRTVFVPAKIEDNPVLVETDPGYIAFLESFKDKDPGLYDAWRKGNWTGAYVEGSYYRAQLDKAEADLRISDVPYDELLPVYTWCDLGVADAFAIVYMQYAYEKWRVIDYDEFEGESLQYAARIMSEKKYKFAQHYGPHDLRVREIGSEAKSRLEIAKALGVDYEIVPELSVADGINALRMRFNTLWFDKTKCKLLLKRLRTYQKEFDEKRGIWKDKPLHNAASHGADAMRYWAVTPEPDRDNVAEQYTPRIRETQARQQRAETFTPRRRP